MTIVIESVTILFSGAANFTGEIRNPRTVSVISVPINLGQPRLGPDLTPSALFQHGLANLLSSCNWRIEQIPECVLSNHTRVEDIERINAKNCDEVGSVCRKLYTQVQNEIQKGNFILILGGDHCIPIGSIPAIMHNRPNTGIIWVDAHGDINTPSTSPSGNMHGMPLAFLLGLVENAKTLPSMEWFEPCLSPQDIIYIGLRDLDPGEKAIIKKLGIKTYTMYDVDKYGIGHIMEECKKYFSTKNIHLSFDIDAVDPFFAPHTGTAVRGGLTFREANYICEALAETGNLTSMELVEVNPSVHNHQPSTLTLEMALTLIGSTLGQRIL
eukprot:gene2860-5622_t